MRLTLSWLAALPKPWRGRLPLLIVLAVGGLLTYSAVRALQESAHERAAALFRQVATEAAWNLDQSLRANLTALESVATSCSLLPDLDRFAFRALAWRKMASAPYLEALAWVPRVSAGERAAFEAAARAEGEAGFALRELAEAGKLREAGPRAEYFPVQYVENASGSRLALGFDMASSLARREALEQARDTGAAAATQGVTLLTEPAENTGVVLFWPIYRRGVVPDTVAERRANLRGFVVAVIRLGDFVERSLPDLNMTAYALHLYDEWPDGALSILYQSPHHRDSAAVREDPRFGLEERFRYDVGGRHWLLVVHPTSAFTAGLGMSAVPLAIGSGVLVTLLVALYVESLRGRARQMAAANAELAAEVAKRKQAEEETLQEAIRAQTMARVAGRLNAQAELPELLYTVCAETAWALGVPVTAIRLYDDETATLRLAASYLQPEVTVEMPLAIPADLGEETLRTGSPLVITDLLTAPDAFRLKDLAAGSARTLVAASLRDEGRLLGVLSLVTLDSPREFSREELGLIQALADQAALAVVKAQLFQDNLRQLARLRALNASAQQLAQSLDVQELAASVTRNCVEDFGAKFAWLGTVQPDGELRPLAPHPAHLSELCGLDPGGVGERTGPCPLCVRAVESGQAVVADLTDARVDTALAKPAAAVGARSAAAFPLVGRTGATGALVLYSEQAKFFTSDRVEFFAAYAHQAAAALENARLFQAATTRLEQLQALREIDAAITGSLDLSLTLKVVLAQVVRQLSVDAAAVLLLKEITQTLEHAGSRGFRGEGIAKVRLPLFRSALGTTMADRQQIVAPGPTAAAAWLAELPTLQEEGFQAFAALPLVAKGQLKGALLVFQRSPLAVGPEWPEYFRSLASQAAIAVDNATMFEDLQRSHSRLLAAYDATIEGWSRALDLRDHETEGHSLRVADLSVRLAEVLGVGGDELTHLRRGALLHDIGKVGVPDHILHKAGPLTDEEWAIMRQHPVHAYRLLASVQFLRAALLVPYCYHEKWDGTGYPRGLKGKEIPLVARIFAVADVWDALTSDRPYRPAWSKERAIAYICEQAGKHFDPEVVAAFLQLAQTGELD